MATIRHRGTRHERGGGTGRQEGGDGHDRDERGVRVPPHGMPRLAVVDLRKKLLPHSNPPIVNAGAIDNALQWLKILPSVSECFCPADFCVETCLAGLQTAFDTKKLPLPATAELHPASVRHRSFTAGGPSSGALRQVEVFVTGGSGSVAVQLRRLCSGAAIVVV